jgi:hypothetical protein
MANSLLDFVMSLVRDPDAAAAYAADPAQAIANANLTDVTSADVNHLIPVVAESLSSAVPSHDSFSGPAADADHNVWTSGAATAAFDAFDDHLPHQVVDDPGGVINDVGMPDHAVLAPVGSAFDVPTVAGADDPGLQLHQPVGDDVSVLDTSADPDWLHHAGVADSLDGHHPLPDDPGFDDLI